MKRYRVFEHPEGVFKVQISEDGGLTWTTERDYSGTYPRFAQELKFKSLKEARKLIEDLKEYDRRRSIARVVYEE